LPESRSLAVGSGGRILLTLVSFTLAILPGCKKDEEVTYAQFNGDEDTLSVEVGAKKALPALSIELHSTTGEVIVGTAEVDPGGGPIGTEHAVVVIVADDYENVVDRVSIRTDSGDRGEDEFDLDVDSADEGYYKTTLVSVGEEGEIRTDTLTVRLWDIEDDEDGDTTTTDSGTEE
jgi:hypothetical protein